ncbi:AcrR family transcriptional regulator [Mycolicibacterium iranicum]|uniref:AcrR family transcriptional regulator n=1 Tax=Mycolicibacterium iranicum TaxID=912594 RepID=A0A839Q8J1_MYCIR|nr:TetR-like C-terminal domain-containing protein [Mycolicibacterium iranicum]MBB2991154.1 AcrR family transcriptional regulator [Mycolicibacterium iranicum]
MSDTEAAQRAAAIDAALAEVQQWGVDRFRLEGVAQRAKLSPDYVRRTWATEQELIAEALLHYSKTMMTLPDTGSLHGDLVELALALAGYLNEPVGRRISRMLVIDSRSEAVDPNTRGHFWSVRRDMVECIFRRASERGELRSDVKPIVALQLLTSPLHTFALYSNDPISPEYCRTIADLVTRAISPD